MTSIPTRALARPSQIIGCIETELLTRSHKSERELLLFVRGGLTAALHCNGSSPRGGTPRRHASARRSKSGSLRLRACVLYSEQKNMGIFSGNADLDESPLTQRVPIVHGLSRACRAPVKPRRSAPASEQLGAHCWLRPRPRPRRSRVCQNTSLEPHRRLARGSAYRLHGSAPRFPQSSRRLFKISTARKGAAPAFFVTSLQTWSL